MTITTDKILEDLQVFCAICSAPFNLETSQSITNIYKQEFETLPIEFRTTTKTNREVSFRFVDMNNSEDPYSRATEAGLISDSAKAHPVGGLVSGLFRNFDFLGHGVDIGAAYGLEKIWPFLDKAYPLTDIGALESLPRSFHNSTELLEELKLTHVSIIAADYRKHTMNLYFPLPPPHNLTAEQASTIIERLGWGPVDTASLDLLELAGFANISLDWEHDMPVRFCLYLPLPDLAMAPDSLGPSVMTLLKQSPFVVPQHSFILGPTWGNEGHYLKIENDYGGKILTEVFPKCMSVPREVHGGG